MLLPVVGLQKWANWISGFKKGRLPAVGKLESMCSDFGGVCCSRLRLEWCTCVMEAVCSLSSGCTTMGPFSAASVH